MGCSRLMTQSSICPGSVRPVLPASTFKGCPLGTNCSSLNSLGTIIESVHTVSGCQIPFHACTTSNSSAASIPSMQQ